MSPYIKYLPLPTILTLTSWTALVHNVKFQNKPRGLYFFQRPFLRGLFLEGLIFGGSCPRREICVSKSIGLGLQLKVNLPFLLCFSLYLSTSPLRGLYLEGRFYGEFFALPVRGAYIWSGLYMKGLIFGILRYLYHAEWRCQKRVKRLTRYVCVCLFFFFK